MPQEGPVESLEGTVAGAILQLDRDDGIFPGYFAAVAIRTSADQVFNTTQVRGTLSQILKGDYRADNKGRHTVFIQSDESNQSGTVYTLFKL